MEMVRQFYFLCLVTSRLDKVQIELCIYSLEGLKGVLRSCHECLKHFKCLLGQDWAKYDLHLIGKLYIEVYIFLDIFPR